jgi:hydroxyacylglutathione hydrolase
MIRVKTFFAANELRNFSYLIFDEASGASLVVDPYDAEPMIEYIKKQGLLPPGILNTHRHWDHIKGNAPIQTALGSPIRQLDSGGLLPLGEGSRLEVLDAPGHTMDHQVFILYQGGKAQALFAGDTLFNAGVGNCKNGGDVDALYRTVSDLIGPLPDELQLLPGHDYLERNLAFVATVDPENKSLAEFQDRLKEAPAARLPLTLGDERRINPFLRLEAEGPSRLVDNSVADPEEKRRELFKKLRSLRDRW